MPAAKDMNQLYWDCNIEYNAYLLNCGDAKAQVPTDFGEIFASINLGRKCKSPEENTTPILQQWWNEVKLDDLSNPTIDITAKPQLKEFAMMANGPTTGFACTYNKKCSDKLLCLYDKLPSKNQNANVLYTKAVNLPADVCSCPGCVNYLCPTDPYVPSTATYPQSSCTTPANPEDGMTYEMQATAQDMVNYYRRLVGSGWALDKSGYAPTAKQMPAVEYDCKTLAPQNSIGQETKTLAAACTAPAAPTPGYSVSYYQGSLTKTPEEVLREAIKSWAEQSKLVDLEQSVTFSGNVENAAPDFARMVDETATKVTCSVTTDECQKQGFRAAVCQYNNPISNGDPVYTTGKTCSGCNAQGLKCDNDLGGGLCV
ncbi:hypothetical protein Aduo_000214 [Ancylostoma duodenale]